MGDLDGRVALVTGSGRNVGRGIALGLAEAGCDVVVNASAHRQEAEDVAAEIVRMGRRAIAVVADVSQSDQVDAMVRDAKARLGRIDILVNSAAIRPHSHFTEITDELWDQVLGVNLKGPFNTCRAVARLMIEQRSGVIINISGAAALHGGIHDAHIAASKAGLHGLTKALAVELGEFGIRVNTLVLSSMDTVRTLPSETSPAAASNPLGRKGRPLEVGGVCAFIASDKASYITGQTIGVNGGAVLIG